MMGKPAKVSGRHFARPLHKTVNWGRTKLASNQRHRLVESTCPDCGMVRWSDASYVARQIENGLYTGRCSKCHRASGAFKGTRFNDCLVASMVAVDQAIQMPGGDYFCGCLTDAGKKLLAGYDARFGKPKRWWA